MIDPIFGDDDDDDPLFGEPTNSESNIVTEKYVEDTTPVQVFSPEKLKRIMDEISRRTNTDTDFMETDEDKISPINKSQLDGNIEEHPEYQLIVESNNLITEIDDEIKNLEKFVREIYTKRFPELAVAEPMEYMQTVRILGNDLDQVKTNEKLSEILDPKTNMLVNMTASTTRGAKLEPDELNQIFEACDRAIDLNVKKSVILSFVESRMALIAPNLSIIVGPSVAAKLLSLSGGLTRLSTTPACNVPLLGAPRASKIGYASNGTLPPRMGVIYLCDIVQNVPKQNLKDIRRNAVRMLANKCILAARCDAKHASPDGEQGRKFRQVIERNLAKLLEPPPKKSIRPLPAPIDKSKKKRGGKRVRRMKERHAMTEMRKQANRMNFGQVGDDAYQDNLGFNSGQLGRSGKLRATQVDEKTRIRLSKTMKKTLEKHGQHVYNLPNTSKTISDGNSTTIKRQVSGTTSTITFTPMQGIEITNTTNSTPSGSSSTATSKAAVASGSRYFSRSSSFLCSRAPLSLAPPVPKFDQNSDIQRFKKDPHLNSQATSSDAHISVKKEPN